MAVTPEPQASADPFPLPARLGPVYDALRSASRVALCIVSVEDWPDARSRLEMAGGDCAVIVMPYGSVAVLSTVPVPGRPDDGLAREYSPQAAAEALRVSATVPGVRIELSERWAAWCGRRDADRSADPATPAT